MSLALWISHADEWLAAEKVNFNGTTREIHVNDGVTQLDIQEDVYSAWIRWLERDDNERYEFAMRFTGLDPIPGGQTGGTFFLINGWKLVYDPRSVAVSGILYSDDYPTAYYFTDGSPVYPAVVSALSLTGSSAPIDYVALAAAVASQFAEPSMTTAGIALATSSAIGTVDVDPVGIADEVQSRFTFGSDGRVAADINGSASEKELKRAVTAAIPSPTSAQTIWEAAPKHLLKEFQAKDYTKSLSSISKKIEDLAASIPKTETQFNVDLAPLLSAIESGDTNAKESAEQILKEIGSIKIPDNSVEIGRISDSLTGIRDSVNDLGFDVIGVRNLIKTIPSVDLSDVATKSEISSLRKVAEKLRNYDDSEIKSMIADMLEEIVASTSGVDKKLNMVLDNQLSLL